MMCRFTYIIIGVIVILCSACEHKELCEHHPHTAGVCITADWSEFSQGRPHGMTVIAYPQGGGAPPVTLLTHSVECAEMQLSANNYNTIVFNKSESEFGSFEFRGMEKYETALICPAITRSVWYKSRGDEEQVTTSPEWLAVDRQENALVTQEMVENAGEEIQNLGRQRSANKHVIAHHIPKDVICTISVVVHIKGFQNLRSARASLDGLAGGYYLASGQRADFTVTQLLEEWSATVDPTDPTKGEIRASITSFGLPNSHQGLSAENIFLLDILLVDNKTIVPFLFEVGDMFDYSPDSEINVVLNFHLELTLDQPLPDVKPVGGSSSGFDATVDDWGDEENFEVGV